MLKYAYQYKEELEIAMVEALYNPKYKFYFLGGYNDFRIDLAESDWKSLQMVSVQNQILGYLHCSIDRSSRMAYELGAINLKDNSEIAFAFDFAKFIDEILINRGMRKIEWSVAIGNPAEEIYDRACKRFEGRIIGTARQSAITLDGTLHDTKMYELFAEDYIRNRRTHGIL